MGGAVRTALAGWLAEAAAPPLFYEAIWGYPAQDVTLTLYDLRYSTAPPAPGDAALRAAFARGYASRQPWPEAHPGQLDTLVAGRRLRQANWVLWRETAPSLPARAPCPIRRRSSGTSSGSRPSSAPSWTARRDSPAAGVSPARSAGHGCPRSARRRTRRARWPTAPRLAAAPGRGHVPRKRVPRSPESHTGPVRLPRPG